MDRFRKVSLKILKKKKDPKRDSPPPVPDIPTRDRRKDLRHSRSLPLDSISVLDISRENSTMLHTTGIVGKYAANNAIVCVDDSDDEDYLESTEYLYSQFPPPPKQLPSPSTVAELRRKHIEQLFNSPRPHDTTSNIVGMQRANTHPPTILRSRRSRRILAGSISSYDLFSDAHLVQGPAVHHPVLHQPSTIRHSVVPERDNASLPRSQSRLHHRTAVVEPMSAELGYIGIREPRGPILKCALANVSNSRRRPL